MPEERDKEAEIASLKKQNAQLRAELTRCQENLHQKNLALDALCFVWCSGGCRKGVCRYSGRKLTKELLEKAEKNTRRMREWFKNSKAAK